MIEKEIIAWLSRAYWLKIKIEKLQQQRHELAIMAESARGMDYSKSPSSGGEPTTIADNVLGLVTLDSKIAGKIAEYFRVVDEIMQTISSVEDERLSTLLYLRYVKGERWEQISVAIGYAWRQTHRLHHQALEAINQKMAHNGTRNCDIVYPVESSEKE